MDIITDKLGNEIVPGDIVAYVDNWPDGRGVYPGKITHQVPSGRIAILGPINATNSFPIYRDPTRLIKLPSNYEL